VAAVLFAFASAYHALHTTQGLHGGLEDAPLAAAEYRAPIVEVEAILFAPGPLSMEDRIQLAQAMDVMRRELDARGGTDLAKFSAREIGALADMSRGLGELGGADLERVRSNWMRIRSNTFADDASWYRFSEADPVAAREEERIELTVSDRAALDGLRATLDRIEQAIERGARDCERLGEAESDWDQGRGEAFAQSWRDWGEGWTSELENLRGWMPAAPGPGASPGLRFVHEAAASALRQLESVPNLGRGRWNAPYRQDWERAFQGAAKQVRDARFWIERAEKGLGV
jgi:hypothetical protein